MDYLKLITGTVLLVSFSWVLIKNGKRSGVLHAILRIDTIIGVVAGVYLVLTSVHSILS